MKLLMLFCIFCVFVTACTEVKVDEDFLWKTPHSDQLEIMQAIKNAGYTGKHKLVRLNGFIGVAGNVSGSWSIFGGGIEGSISSSAHVKYLWYVAEKQPFIHVFPFDRIRLMIDDECIEPTIRYQFNVCSIYSTCREWLVLHGQWSDWDGARQSYEATITDMLIGSIISPKTVIKATIVISQ